MEINFNSFINCEINKCNNISQVNNLCFTHLLKDLPKTQDFKLCYIHGCFNKIQSKHLCKKHGGGTKCIISYCTNIAQYNKLCRQHGGIKLCEIDDCNKQVNIRNRCFSHRIIKKCSYFGCDINNDASCRKFCKIHKQLFICQNINCKKISKKKYNNRCFYHYNKSKYVNDI